MNIRTTLIVFSVAVVSAFAGFVGGFREGSNASLWSDFVLKGVIAGYLVEVLEKGNKDVAVSGLKGQVETAFIAQTELSRFSGYAYLSPLTGVWLHGLYSENTNRLEKYRYLLSSKEGR